LARHLAPGGAVILSGLLRTQGRGVVAVYAGHGFRRLLLIDLGVWSSLLLGSGLGRVAGKKRKRPPLVTGAAVPSDRGRVPGVG
jgi:hypothetical protein